MMAGSEDGLNFGEEALYLEHAEVPHLLRTSTGQLIATYQFFSFEDEALFGIMAYSTSNDDGNTWEGPFSIVYQNVPPLQGESKLVDPCLVELADETLRLYFTIHPKGFKNAHSASAFPIFRSMALDTMKRQYGGISMKAIAAIVCSSLLGLLGGWAIHMQVPISTASTIAVTGEKTAPRTFLKYSSENGTPIGTDNVAGSADRQSAKCSSNLI